MTCLILPSCPSEHVVAAAVVAVECAWDVKSPTAAAHTSRSAANPLFICPPFGWVAVRAYSRRQGTFNASGGDEAHPLVHRLERRRRGLARLVGADGEQPVELGGVGAKLPIARLGRAEQLDGRVG